MIFKCKMCGGDIEPIENTNTGKCLYCKSIMTLPNLDNEKIINLYNRANELRLECEFDKAYDVYEKILEIDNKQVEAHWGLLLCKYGIEYVDDPKTKKKIPTCHRTIAGSILSDKDYKYVIKTSYGEALELYEKEAKEITKIQKRILEISNKEEPYDIFICYKETDDKGERTYESVMAEDIYEALIKEGYKVFFSRITLEDKLGKEFEPYIYSALKTSKLMLVVGTNEDNFNSIWVKNEWSRYLEFMKKNKSKYLIPVYSKIDAYKLPEEFVNLQAQNMDKIGAMQDLIRGIKKILANSNNNNTDEYIEKKFQEVGDGVKNLGNGRYEVTEIREKLPTWYYVFALILFSISSISMLFSVWDRQVFSFINGEIKFTNAMIIDFNYFWFMFIVGCIGIVALILKLLSRKKYKIANYLYYLMLIIIFIMAFSLLNKGYIIFVAWYIVIIMIVILCIVNPKWYINYSKKTIVDKEGKDKIIKKNEYIRNNFTDKEIVAVKNSVILSLFLVGFIVYILLAKFYYKII